MNQTMSYVDDEGILHSKGIEEEPVGAPEVAERKEGMTLAKLLRIMGTLLLLGSAGAFMLQSWSLMSFSARYLTFLGFTTVLAGAGVFCGVRLQEDKGARTFLSIAAAFLPAHFVQLSATLYSSLYGTPVGLNRYFVVTANGIGEPMTLIGLALPVLIGVSFFAFSAMLRAEAKMATLVYLLANLAILIPTRDPNHIAIISLGVFGMLAYYQQFRLKGRAITHSKEGVLTQAILISPYLTLLARTCFLYSPTAAFECATYLVVTLMSAFISRSLIRGKTNSEQSLQWVCERLTFIAAAATWYRFATGVIFPLPGGLEIPVIGLPTAAIFFCLSFFGQGEGRGYRRIASWIAIGSVMTQLMCDEGILSSAICLVTSVFITAAAHQMKERGMFFAGICGLTYGVAYHLKYAARFYSFSPWMSLAILGTVVLLTSSYLERNFSVICERVRQMKSQMNEWK